MQNRLCMDVFVCLRNNCDLNEPSLSRVENDVTSHSAATFSADNVSPVYSLPTMLDKQLLIKHVF